MNLFEYSGEIESGNKKIVTAKINNKIYKCTYIEDYKPVTQGPELMRYNYDLLDLSYRFIDYAPIEPCEYHELKNYTVKITQQLYHNHKWN